MVEDGSTFGKERVHPHLLPPKRRLGPLVLLCALILISGIVIGASGVLVAYKDRIDPPRPDRGYEMFVEHLMRDLDLTEQQGEQLKTLAKSNWEAMSEIRETFGAQMAQIREEFDKQLQTILTSDQYAEWQEMRRRFEEHMERRRRDRRGGRDRRFGTNISEMVNQLELSEEQREKIDAIREESERSAEEIPEKRDEIMQDRGKQIMDVLTEEQKEELRRRMERRGRGRRGGPRDGNGRGVFEAALSRIELTDEQREAIEDIQSQSDERFRRAKDPNEFRAAFEDMREAMGAVLTNEQRAKLDAELDAEMERMRRDRGGQDSRRGGGPPWRGDDRPGPGPNEPNTDL